MKGGRLTVILGGRGEPGIIVEYLVDQAELARPNQGPDIVVEEVFRNVWAEAVLPLSHLIFNILEIRILFLKHH